MTVLLFDSVGLQPSAGNPISWNTAIQHLALKKLVFHYIGLSIDVDCWEVIVYN